MLTNLACPVGNRGYTKTARRSLVLSLAVLGAFAATLATAEAGKRATPVATGHTFSGVASFYGSESGNKTASGQRFNPSAMTAAHRTLPFGTKLRVTEPRSGRSVVVTVNDRGPYIGGRVIDLSSGAARVLGMTDRGVARIVAEVI